MTKNAFCSLAKDAKNKRSPIFEVGEGAEEDSEDEVCVRSVERMKEGIVMMMKVFCVS